jgi:hypothetical protein
MESFKLTSPLTPPHLGAMIAAIAGTHEVVGQLDLPEVPNVEKFPFPSRRNAEHPTYWVPKSQASRDEVVEAFSATLRNGQTVRLAAVQDQSEIIQKPVPFKEGRLLERAVWAGDAIELEFDQHLTIGEHVPAMQRHLRTHMFDIPHWCLVRPEGNSFCAFFRGVLRAAFKGSRQILLRSAISLDGKSLGTVDFARRD